MAPPFIETVMLMYEKHMSVHPSHSSGRDMISPRQKAKRFVNMLTEAGRNVFFLQRNKT